jgi:hypothetical protein
MRVDDDRDLSFSPGAKNFGSPGDMSGNHPLNFFLALEDSFTEGHFPSHSQRLGNFGYADSEAGTGEAMSHTRGHLSSPFDQDNQVFQTSDAFVHNERCSKEDLPQSSQRT